MPSDADRRTLTSDSGQFTRFAIVTLTPTFPDGGFSTPMPKKDRSMEGEEEWDLDGEEENNGVNQEQGQARDRRSAEQASEMFELREGVVIAICKPGRERATPMTRWIPPRFLGEPVSQVHEPHSPRRFALARNHVESPIPLTLAPSLYPTFQANISLTGATSYDSEVLLPSTSSLFVPLPSFPPW